MKKYIYTETQIKTVIDSIMNEHIIKEQSLDLLKLKDLAELVSRLGYEKETLLKMFIEMYRKEGSEGVIRIFNSATDLDLEDFGYGRFHLKN
jgi:hypothetical protein